MQALKTTETSGRFDSRPSLGCSDQETGIRIILSLLAKCSLVGLQR